MKGQFVSNVKRPEVLNPVIEAILLPDGSLTFELLKVLFHHNHFAHGQDPGYVLRMRLLMMT